MTYKGNDALLAKLPPEAIARAKVKTSMDAEQKRKPQRQRINWHDAPVIEVELPRCKECGMVLTRSERYHRDDDGGLTRRAVCKCGAAYVLLFE